MFSPGRWNKKIFELNLIHDQFLNNLHFDGQILPLTHKYGQCETTKKYLFIKKSFVERN